MPQLLVIGKETKRNLYGNKTNGFVVKQQILDSKDTNLMRMIKLTAA